MKFTKIEEYNAQEQKRKQSVGQIREREAQAKEEVARIEHQREQLITDSIKTGEDIDGKLDELDLLLEEAKKKDQRASQQRQVVQHVRPDNQIEPMDVVNAWNGEYNSEFRKEKLDPALERLLEAKKEFASAALGYFGVISEHEDEQMHVASQLGDAYRYKLKPVKLEHRNEVEKYFLTERDLREIQWKEVPQSIKDAGGIE